MGKSGIPRHRQTLKPFVCTRCKIGECDGCIDVSRVLMCKKVSDFVPICKCRIPGHDGEPAGKQIRDPFDGSVHAPGLVVTEDGEVTRHE